jgi:CheY-like chemotaxis protein
MTPEMVFDCLLVSHDPAVVCVLDPILQDLSMSTSVCPDATEASDILRQVSTDLVVVDLDNEDSTELVRRLGTSELHQKPTVLGVSATDRVLPGVHVLLRKPFNQQSGMNSLRRAYSRMVQDFRKHTRFALMTSVVARDEQDRPISIMVTNIGQGGLGFTAKIKIVPGTVLSMRVPLSGLGHHITIRARVLWNRDYGAAGCAFVELTDGDGRLLRDWLESKYRIRKPLIAVEE